MFKLLDAATFISATWWQQSISATVASHSNLRCFHTWLIGPQRAPQFFGHMWTQPSQNKRAAVVTMGVSARFFWKRGFVCGMKAIEPITGFYDSRHVILAHSRRSMISPHGSWWCSTVQSTSYPSVCITCTRTAISKAQASIIVGHFHIKSRRLAEALISELSSLVCFLCRVTQDFQVPEVIQAIRDLL